MGTTYRRPTIMAPLETGKLYSGKEDDLHTGKPSSLVLIVRTPSDVATECAPMSQCYDEH